MGTQGKTYQIWARLGPISTNRPRIADKGIVRTKVSPPSIVSALEKSAADHYLVLVISFKGILRRNQFPWDFG